MPASPTLRVCVGKVMRRLPRILAVVWGVWCVATAVAYVHHVPQQLAAVDSAVTAPVWAVWATAATLLIVGSLVPGASPPQVQNVSRWARIIGMAVACAMLIMWSAAFFVDEPRGWVSAKNYALLAVMAMVSSWIIARDSAKRQEVTAT